MKKNKFYFIISVGVGMLLLTGCVHYTRPETTRIKEVEQSDCRSCQLLGQVFGESKYAYLAVGLEVATDEAKKQAIDLGATHLVWTHKNTNGFPYVVGRAYRCSIDENNVHNSNFLKIEPTA